jgi:hypothetical protein
MRAGVKLSIGRKYPADFSGAARISAKGSLRTIVAAGV